MTRQSYLLALVLALMVGSALADGSHPRRALLSDEDDDDSITKRARVYTNSACEEDNDGFYKRYTLLEW